MKKFLRKWLQWWGMVFSAMLTLLGVGSCWRPQPVMYGVPSPGVLEDSVRSDSSALQGEVRAMYGVTPVSYRKVVETEPGNIMVDMYNQVP